MSKLRANSNNSKSRIEMSSMSESKRQLLTVPDLQSRKLISSELH